MYFIVILLSRQLPSRYGSGPIHLWAYNNNINIYVKMQLTSNWWCRQEKSCGCRAPGIICCVCSISYRLMVTFFAPYKDDGWTPRTANPLVNEQRKVSVESRCWFTRDARPCMNGHVLFESERCAHENTWWGGCGSDPYWHAASVIWVITGFNGCVTWVRKKGYVDSSRIS